MMFWLLLFCFCFCYCCFFEGIFCFGKALTSKELSAYAQFSPSPAQRTLIKWASEIIKNDGSVSHSEAYSREKYLVEMINKGIWPTEVYTEYQIFSARLGNVDSVRLLLEYGITASVSVLLSQDSQAKKNEDLFPKKFSQSLLSCKLDSIKRYLRKFPGSENYAFHDGNTPLHLAVISNCSQAVQHLLEDADADSSLAGSHGLTPFLLAASLGSVDIVQMLITHNPKDLFHQHKFANTSALHMAAEMGHSQTISKLCELGLNATSTRTILDGTALHTAAQIGQIESIPSLLNPPCSIPVDSLMGGDTTALYLSAQHGHWKAVQLLLKYGANVTFTMPVLTDSRHTREVILSGPSVMTMIINSQPANGATPIHAAAENGHVEVVKVLLKHGVSPDFFGEIGVSPLHLAVQYSHLPIMKLLIDSHATIDLRSLTDGSTPLYYAVGLQNFEMIKLLLRSGASPLARKSQRRQEEADYTPFSPLLYSLYLSNLKIFQTLLQAIPQCVCSNAAEVLTECHLTDLTLFEVAMDSPTSIPKIKNILTLLLRYFTGCDLFSLRSSQNETLIHLLVSSGSAVLLEIVMNHLNKTNSSLLTTLVRERSLSGLTPLHSLFLPHTTQHKQQPPRQVDYLSIIDLLMNAGSLIDPVIHTPPSFSQYEVELIHELQGATPLYLACSTAAGGMDQVINRLLLHGADPNKSLSSSYFTPLIAAIDRSTTAVIQILLFGPSSSSSLPSIQPKLADPNLRIVNDEASARMTKTSSSSSSQSPLLLAVMKGRVDVTRLLLKAGADCNLLLMIQRKSSQTTEKLSLLELAKQRRDYDMLQLLASHPACLIEGQGEL